ncbi:MAG: hydroxyphenylacetyl-CoA thioesterase PaaI [Alphaproteobacteria bacterium]|nr:hydroxyphenylacetyl-CoA thioesterase PaaI [Alphaproteobacteria bacterium]
MTVANRLTPDALAKACAEVMGAQDSASAHLGVSLDHVAPGEARTSMTIEAHHTNGHGICHGGFIFTLADTAFAFACNSYNNRVVAQQASITFLAPGKLGERMIAEAREVARAGRNGIYDVRVSNQHGERIAEFRGHSRTIEGTHLPTTSDRQNV